METANLNKLKKFLKKEFEWSGDKVRFEKLENDRLYATIINEKGEKRRVYWKLEKGTLASIWYYPAD